MTQYVTEVIVFFRKNPKGYHAIKDSEYILICYDSMAVFTI